MTIGDNIKEYRKLKNITQQELSDKTGVSISAINKYENNKREPKTEILKKIAKALDVSLGTLADSENEDIYQSNLKKLRNELSEEDQDLINWSPSSIEYDKEVNEGIKLLNEFLKNNALQHDSEYEYDSMIYKYGIDNIYIFIQEMLKLKFSKENDFDIGMELLFKNLGSSTRRFHDYENKIIKETVVKYIDGMIEIKHRNE
ncbi:MAG: helix-turn-helix domain-containing protein [Clostridium beijerinckii]